MYQFHEIGFIQNISREKIRCRRKTEYPVKLPTKGTKRAMAYDFYANMNYTIVPGEICKIWTDVKAYMNDDEG